MFTMLSMCSYFFPLFTIRRLCISFICSLFTIRCLCICSFCSLFTIHCLCIRSFFLCVCFFFLESIWRRHLIYRTAMKHKILLWNSKSPQFLHGPDLHMCFPTIGIKQFAHNFNSAIRFRRSTIESFNNFSQCRILCGPPQLWQPLLLNEPFACFFAFIRWRKSTTTDFNLPLRPILLNFFTQTFNLIFFFFF